MYSGYVFGTGLTYGLGDCGITIGGCGTGRQLGNPGPT